MHPMNLAVIFSSIKHSLPEKTPPIGVKDLKVVEVLKRYWDYGGNKNYSCQLTFQDNVKVFCEIPGKKITGLIYARTFHAKLTGIPSTERGLNQAIYPNHADVNHDEWISEVYKNWIQKNP